MREFLFKLFMVSRGYSAPMSILNWLVAFVLTVKMYENANALYGLIALIGIVFAHLGTNLFDDCVDYMLNVPKQVCKTEYVKKMSMKTVFIFTVIYFLIACIVGGFFIMKFGIPILYFVLPAMIIIFLYPKLNNFALGELAVGLCFGVLLFMGVSYVMTSIFDINLVFISIPVSLLTVAVLYAHSLMDFDFDKQSGKFTLCQALRTKQNALYGLMVIYFITFLSTAVFIFKNILPLQMLVIVVLLPLVIKLYSLLKNNPENFLVNFKLARNISLFYNLILVAVFFVKR